MYTYAMPKKKLVDYDYSSMLGDRVGRGGKALDELPKLYRDLAKVQRTLRSQKDRHEVGFFSIPASHQELRPVVALSNELRKNYKTLVVIGIGGSDLGARAICKALSAKEKGMEVRFIGANTDPEEIAALLDAVDLKKTVLNVVSKSGDTIEPMSAFLVLRDRLIKRVGEKKHQQQVIATTDGKSGTLRAIADREGYATLPVPGKIGGRFSALTPVGLFPAACAGIPVRDLLAGAERMDDDFWGSAVKDNGPLAFAGLHYDGYIRRHQHITVLMPYAEALREFGFWFRQLWAESLGKKHDRAGQPVHHGLTPVAALGATDQHSQLQLYNEGPADKILTFIETEGFRDDLTVPDPFPDIEGTSYMAGRCFSEIIHAERKATSMSLAANGRPNGTLFIPEISPRSLGALMYFFMLATAAMGELLDVDAYDQPGVEEGKKKMYALLGRKGYTL
jgi:glucose-6-phosphate isomerase